MFCIGSFSDSLFDSRHSLIIIPLAVECGWAYIKSAFRLWLLDFSSKCTKMCLVVWLPTGPLAKLYT